MEERTRIIIYLPLAERGEEKAAEKTINYLLGLRKRRKGTGKVTGFTQTKTPPYPFIGWWWSSKRQKWVVDKIDIVTLDHELEINTDEFKDDVKEIKKKAEEYYEDENVKQDEIWIVTHSIFHIV